MSSVMRPPILNAAAQAAISKARNELGVHVYSDIPHTKINTQFRTPIDNFGATRSTYLTWTVLARATGDSPQFFVHLSDEPIDNTLAMGFSYNINYFIKDMKSWKQKAKEKDSITWKKDQYIVITSRFEYPNGTTVEPVRFESNAEEQKETLLFEKAKDFSRFAYWFSLDNIAVTETEIVEQHLLYSGITQGLKPRSSPGDPISLKDCELCYLSLGGRAVIQGKYVHSNSKYTGIMIGVAMKGSSFPQDFASQKDPDELVTFTVSVGFFDVVIQYESEEKTVGVTINYDDYIWLIVDNINILNMEIHRGTRDPNI